MTIDASNVQSKFPNFLEWLGTFGDVSTVQLPVDISPEGYKKIPKTRLSVYVNGANIGELYCFSGPKRLVYIGRLPNPDALQGPIRSQISRLKPSDKMSLEYLSEDKMRLDVWDVPFP